MWLPTPHELCIEINVAMASSCWSFTKMWPMSFCTTLFTIFSTTIIFYSAVSCHVTSPLFCLLIRTPCLMILWKWFRGYMLFCETSSSSSSSSFWTSGIGYSAHELLMCKNGKHVPRRSRLFLCTWRGLCASECRRWTLTLGLWFWSFSVWSHPSSL